MPRLVKSLPKYRKHRATGKAVVTLHGTDHYLGPYNSKSSKQLYDRLIAEYCSGKREPLAEDSITVLEVIHRYWQFCKTYYVKDGKATSEQGAIRCVVKSLKQLYGSLPATEFGPLALKALRNAWITNGLSRSTINQNVGRIVRMFRWATAEELLPPAVHQALAALPGLRRGRTEAKESQPVPPVAIHIVEATLPHLRPIVADMIRFQLLTGARPGEVCDLRPVDLDRSHDVWEYHVESHKTQHHGRRRVIYIGPEAQTLLETYLARAPEAYCFSPVEAVAMLRAERHAKRTTSMSCGNRPGICSKPKDRAICDNPRSAGPKYTPDSYRRAVHRACDLAFAPPPEIVEATKKKWQSDNRWSPNQLRHTAATDIRKRFGLEAAQVILGHAAADVTQVYAERDADKAREVARQRG